MCLLVRLKESSELEPATRLVKIVSLSFSLTFHLFFVGIALIVWKSWFFPVSFPAKSLVRAALWLGFMFLCFCASYFALANWSSPSVQNDDGEISFYLVFSIFWIAFSQFPFAFAGVSIHDDVAERGNLSAAFAAAGFTIGATCCAAGANIGDGPGFEVVLFCAALSMTTLLFVWGLIAKMSGVTDVITIERDRGAGIRCGGRLAGSASRSGACAAISYSRHWPTYISPSLKTIALISASLPVGAVAAAMAFPFRVFELDI
jgi:hypothetical protein